VVRYYWEVLLKEFMPFSEVQERFVTLALDDPTVRPLSDKIRTNPAFLVRAAHHHLPLACLYLPPST
jgi:hypothetical protein